MISEYTMNTVLQTAVDLNVVNFSNSNQSSEGIDSIILDFEAAFGTHPNVTMTASANKDPKYKPNIKLTQSGCVVEFYMDLFIKNPIEPSITAAKMVTKAITSLSIYVNDDFLLWGSIRDLKLKVVDYEPYFKTQTTLETINSKLALMLPLLEAYANSVLDDGWRIPLSTNVTRYIKKQKV